MPLPDITPNSISTISALGGPGHMLWKARLRTNQELVIKIENGSARDACVSIKWGSKIMKNVSTRDASVSILKDYELAELVRAGASLPPGDVLLTVLNNPGSSSVVTKMIFVPSLHTSPDDRGGANPGAADANALWYRLTYGPAMYELGRILAVDLFIGNMDRFNENGDWDNKGNLFFTRSADGRNHALGLDFFNPAAAEDDISDLAAILPLADYSHLLPLKDPKKRLDYAGKVIGSIHAYLMQMNRKGTYLGLDSFKPHLARGIGEGAAAIKTYLQRKARKYKTPVAAPPRPPTPPPSPVPPRPAGVKHKSVAKGEIPLGVLARMQYLGWGF